MLRTARLSIIRSYSLYTQQWYMSYRFVDSFRAGAYAAGVFFLLIRFSLSFRYWLNMILLLVSGLTIFMAGLGTNFEFDLKRIIVLSALRQLGLIIITISIGLSGLAFFSIY